MQPTKLLRRIQDGHHANIRFGDLQRVVERCGFELDRISGSHHIYTHPEADAVLNLQRVGRVAKPYQVRQFIRMVERYDLIPEELQ